MEFRRVLFRSAGCGLPGQCPQGCAHAGAHREPDRAPERRAQRPHRFYAVLPGHARARIHGRDAGGAPGMSKVLADVRVVEHGTFITGPAASMLLADLGPAVGKVDLTRSEESSGGNECARSSKAG